MSMPRIWYSRLPQTTDFNVSLETICGTTDVKRLAERQRVYQRWQAWSGDDVPLRLFFAPRRSPKIPRSYQDAFKSIGAYITVSRKLRDVLVEFDLGRTQLFEVPIFGPDGRTPTEYPRHYILNVAETKNCFVPEASENVKQFVQLDATEPAPDAPWVADDLTDRLAVRAIAAEGVDLWADTVFRRRIFFSDRLKQAIDAAGVTRRGLDLQEAIVVA